MQVSVEITEGLERKLTIAIPEGRIETAVKLRLQEAAQTIRLNGFRRGKVPFKVVKNKFGKDVRREVVGELMSQTYFEAIAQENLKPAGQPRIEPIMIDEGKDLEFVAVFEVYPEVVLPDFAGIKAERLVAEVSDDDIDDMIETLRKQRQTWEPVERAAADGDMVNIDYVGKKDGEGFQGGSAAGQNLVLGSKQMIPGFEDGVVGRLPGEDFPLQLKFPDNYHAEDLAGVEVEFDVKLNSVSEQSLPRIDEDFFKSFGFEESGAEAFREEVSKNMQREMKTASRNKLKTLLMDSLVSDVEVRIPEALTDNEIQQLKRQAVQQMGGGQKFDPESMPDDLFREQAKRRVTLGLVLGEVIAQQSIKADADKVRAAVEEIAATYESPEEVVQWYYSNEEQLQGIESSVIEDQVFDFIIEQAEVSDKQVSYQEVIKPEPQGLQERTET